MLQPRNARARFHRLAITMSLMVIPFIVHLVQSQSSCSEFTDEAACNFNSYGACLWATDALTGPGGECQCKSETKLDILFALDASGSVGLTGFQILKQFINDLVTQGINTHDSKIGFAIFSSNVNFSRSIRMWNTTELQQYVGGLHWADGYTNTPQVLQESILEFQGVRNGSIYTPDPVRQKVLIMVTDGNPCLPDALGGCPQSVCQYNTTIAMLRVRVIIIGVGTGLNSEFVECLCQTQDDFIPITDFTADDFDSIVGSLSVVLCPGSNETASSPPDDDSTPTKEQTTQVHDVTSDKDDDKSKTHSDKNLIYGGIGAACLLTLGIAYACFRFFKKSHGSLNDTNNRNKNEENRKAMEVVTKGIDPNSDNEEEQLNPEISDHEGSGSEGITKNAAIYLDESKSHDQRMNPRAEGSEHSGNSESMFVVEESENEESHDHNNYNGPIFFETTKKKSISTNFL